jgi:ubiquinone/menaquinone biosynthesis C-methylase UbiE
MEILDLAAGPGVWELALAEYCPAQIVWHDRSAAFFEIARHLHQQASLHNVTYRLADLMELDYPHNSFDLVICRLAIHYAHNEWSVLRNISRIVRPGGYFYVEAPNFRWTFVRPYRRSRLRDALSLCTPALALFTRHKVIRTLFCVETFLNWQLRRRGFVQVWRQESETRAAFRSLWRMQ